MSLPVQINLSEFAGSIRPVIRSILRGVIGNGKVAVNLPEEITFSVKRGDDCIELDWSGRIEADIPGPVDPDLISAKVYETHTDVSLRISSLRINH